MTSPSTTGMGASLQGSLCGRCTVTTYPQNDQCLRCGALMTEIALSRRGQLWSWTVQRFSPKSPPYLPPVDGFVPFVVGYVELAEGVRVEAVVDVPLEQVSMGMALEISSHGGVPHAQTVS